MNPLRIAFLLAFGASGLGLGAMDLQTLVDRSPFAPPKDAAGAGGPQVEAGTLEFRGMVVDEQGTAYSVFDSTANRGYWLRDGEQGPFKIKSFSAQDNLLEVEQNGKPVKLQLKRATIQAGSPVIAAAPRPANVPQPGQSGPAVNRPPGEQAADARRLEAVAAEVRRRRALRNAAANPAVVQNAQPPAPAAP